MKGFTTTLIISLLAIALIAPIGLGAVSGFINTDQSSEDLPSQNEVVNVGLSISESDFTCNIGTEKKLVATTESQSDSYIFQWDSSDKKVATVKRDSESDKACIVTAVGEGTATITVNVIDKRQFKIVESVTCQVTVIDKSISFSLSEVIFSLDESNTATVSAKAPDDGVITWSSEDESIATVVDGVITAHKAGQVYIVAKSGNIEGKLLVKVYNSLFTLEEVKLVGAGNSAQIEVKGTISEGAVWTSSDSRIVTVDENGVITGVKKGMAVIKVSSVTDDLTSSCVVVVSEGTADVVELPSGKKADAANDPGQWYFLCESSSVTIGEIPTLNNGVISLDITHVGDANGNLSGANFFYLRYQPDDVGDVIYKNSLYIYSDSEVVLQVNGKDVVYPAGYNRYEIEYLSSAPSAGSPYQIKFRCTGKFYVIPVFEEISRVEKMTISESFKILNLTDNTSFTLDAIVPNNSNPEIVWTSSNEKVVKVNDGVVSAVGEGSALITAYCGNLSASCLVTVDSDGEVTGKKLSSGNKSATLKAPGSWFYYVDGKTAVNYTPVIDENNNINLSVSAVDEANKKYAYLRYQPEAIATYKVVITIEFAGLDNSVVEISAGDKSAEAKALVNGTNVIEFEFTADSTNPFQMKFKAMGNYVVNVTFSEVN